MSLRKNSTSKKEKPTVPVKATKTMSSSKQRPLGQGPQSSSVKNQESYLTNLMEPDVPFVSPGPAKWLYPVNLRTTMRVPASTYSHGSLSVSTVLDQFVEISKDTALSGNWGSSTESTLTFPRNIPFYLSGNLANATSEDAESLEFDAPVYSFPSEPNGRYFPGNWQIKSPSLAFTISASVSGNYTIVIGTFNPSSRVVTAVASVTTAVTPSVGQIVVPVAADTNVSNITFSIIRETGVTTMGNLSIALQQSNNLLRYVGNFTQKMSFSEVFSTNQSAVELLRDSLGFKISAMSVRLQNTTAELNRGGALNMAQFGPGGYELIPPNPADAYNFLGAAPSVMALAAQPLKDGGHISFVPQEFEQLQFQEYPGRRGSILVFAWQNTPNTLGGYYQQDLTLEIKMNIEISSMDPSLRYSLRSPLHYDYVEWFRAYEGTLHSASGCNPTHMSRILSNVRQFVNHPATRQIASLLAKAAPAALALI